MFTSKSSFYSWKYSNCSLKKKKKKKTHFFGFALQNAKVEKYLVQNIIMEFNYNMTEIVDMHADIKAEFFNP